MVQGRKLVNLKEEKRENNSELLGICEVDGLVVENYEATSTGCFIQGMKKAGIMEWGSFWESV